MMVGHEWLASLTDVGLFWNFWNHSWHFDWLKTSCPSGVCIIWKFSANFSNLKHNLMPLWLVATYFHQSRNFLIRKCKHLPPQKHTFSSTFHYSYVFFVTGIRHIVTLCPEKVPPLANSKFEWTFIPVPECHAPSIQDIFKFIRVVQYCRKKNQVIFFYVYMKFQSVCKCVN